MKRNIVRVAFLILGFAVVSNSQTVQSGDVWLWIPFDAAADAKDQQIVRNSEYISVKFQAAHISYKSGFLENIRQIVISSSVGFGLEGKAVVGTNINRTWQKSNNSEDSVLVNDLLTELAPAAANSISIKVNFNGIGQDRFKSIFDILSSADFKTAVNFSPARLAQVGLATSITQKFLSSPYTSTNPKDVLSMSQSFVIYPNKSALKADSFKKGYIIVISGSERKSSDLSTVVQLPISSIRFNTDFHILQVKGADDKWRQFTWQFLRRFERRNRCSQGLRYKFSMV
jgi:hypothetical protein